MVFGDGVEGSVAVVSRGGVGRRGGAGAVGERRARRPALRHRHALHAALQQTQIHTATVSISHVISIPIYNPRFVKVF